jgi:hypothetical protein
MRPHPHIVDASDLLFLDRIGEGSGANPINVATIVEEMTGRFDGLFGRSRLDELVRTQLPKLNEPIHVPNALQTVWSNSAVTG